MLKRILSVLAGVIAAVVVISVVQQASHHLYPPPPGFDFKNKEAVKAFMATLPIGAYLMVLLSYALGSLVGGTVATLLSGRTTMQPGLIVGAFLMVMGFINLYSIPHPVWFAIVSTVLYVPLAWMASRMALRGSALTP